MDLLKSIMLLDKPAGPTSMACSEKAREIFSAKKSGHAGTLDPQATGVLIIALDEATKAMPVLMGLDKEYEGIIHMHKDFTKAGLEEAAKSLTGKITQRPPVRSAVSRQSREREIRSFEITGTSGRDVSFRIRCQAGTYIRKLCSDLGEKTGLGAHMKSLRRTCVGPFSLKECATFESLENPGKYLMPLEKAFERIGIRRIFIKPAHVQKILNGSPVLPSYAEKSDPGIRKGDYVGIFSGGKLIALGITSEGKSLARTDRIFKT